MSIEQFAKDHGANVIAFAALMVLGYQVWSTNNQFSELNKGLLNAMPRLDPALDNATAVQRVPFGGEQVVPADFAVDALNPVAELQNFGNLPLRYRVLKFDVWLNDQLRTQPFTSTDNVTGVLFPKAGTQFRRPGIRPDLRGPMAFAQLQKLTARIHLQISYGTNADNERMFDRELEFRLLGNGGDILFKAINDKW